MGLEKQKSLLRLADECFAEIKSEPYTGPLVKSSLHSCYHRPEETNGEDLSDNDFLEGPIDEDL